MNTENKPGINQQNYSHQEGQMDNITPQQGDAQRGPTNNSHGMSDMMNDSEEQKAGRDHDQQEKGRSEQGERQS